MSASQPRAVASAAQAAAGGTSHNAIRAASDYPPGCCLHAPGPPSPVYPLTLPLRTPSAPCASVTCLQWSSFWHGCTQVRRHAQDREGRQSGAVSATTCMPAPRGTRCSLPPSVWLRTTCQARPAHEGCRKRKVVPSSLQLDPARNLDIYFPGSCLRERAL